MSLLPRAIYIELFDVLQSCQETIIIGYGQEALVWEAHIAAPHTLSLLTTENT